MLLSIRLHRHPNSLHCNHRFSSSRHHIRSLLVVGAGGLAHAALAQIFSASSLTVPLKITIIDYDHVELSNLNRQIFFDDADIGKPKAESLAETELPPPMPQQLAPPAAFS